MRTSCTKQTTMYELIGRSTPSGKRLLVPGYPGKKVKYNMIMRACGSCTGCRVKRRMDWAFRLKNESEYHPHSWFVTLTYDDENLPHGGSLYHEHISKFVRALRKKQPEEDIRFFGVGEYGKAQQSNMYLARPHYHLILFGPDFPDRVILPLKPSGFIPSPQYVDLFGPGSGAKHFESETMSSCWKRGFVQFSATSEATMNYVTKYHIDKVTGDKAEEHYSAIADNGELIIRERETARMSRNPGIGRQWIEDNWQTIYPKGYVEHGPTKFSPPAYYDRWLEENHPQIFEEVKAKRSEEISLEMLIEHRRMAIEKNQEAQLKCPVKIGSGTYKGPGLTATDLNKAFRK